MIVEKKQRWQRSVSGFRYYDDGGSGQDSSGGGREKGGGARHKKNDRHHPSPYRVHAFSRCPPLLGLLFRMPGSPFTRSAFLILGNVCSSQTCHFSSGYRVGIVRPAFALECGPNFLERVSFRSVAPVLKNSDCKKSEFDFLQCQ
jgi:hypothetical protein